jgi:hypothetical protein
VVDDKKPKTERLGFRADQELATRVDDLVNAMDDSPRLKGLDANMTVALKMLVRRALPLAELEYLGFIPGMTAEEEGDLLLSELRGLVSRATAHPGVDEAALLEMANFLRSDVELRAKVGSDRSALLEDPEYKSSREFRKRRVLERREKKHS